MVDSPCSSFFELFLNGMGMLVHYILRQIRLYLAPMGNSHVKQYKKQSKEVENLLFEIINTINQNEGNYLKDNII